jgi:hypothetical protein
MIREWRSRRRDEALLAVYRAVADMQPVGFSGVRRRVRMRPARVARALTRLERLGWVVGDFEPARDDGQQPRRLYRAPGPTTRRPPP